MSDPLNMICEISGCSRDRAAEVFEQTKDVVEAIDFLMEKRDLPSQKYIPAKFEQVLTKEQIEVRKVRSVMKEMDDKRGPTLLNRPAQDLPGERPARPEEKVQ
jgi:hypothetical protein